jgi:hypothetical protein
VGTLLRSPYFVLSKSFEVRLNSRSRVTKIVRPGHILGGPICAGVSGTSGPQTPQRSRLHQLAADAAEGVPRGSALRSFREAPRTRCSARSRVERNSLSNKANRIRRTLHAMRGRTRRPPPRRFAIEFRERCACDRTKRTDPTRSSMPRVRGAAHVPRAPARLVRRVTTQRVEPMLALLVTRSRTRRPNMMTRAI